MQGDWAQVANATTVATGLRGGHEDRTEAATGSGGRQPEQPFLSPEPPQGPLEVAGHLGPPGVANPEPELSRDATRTFDVEVMYGAAGEQGPAVVRWVARLTDFLRTTATAAAGAGGFQERVLEGLGMTGTQGSPSPQQTLTSPQQQQFQQHGQQPHHQQYAPQQQQLQQQAPQQQQLISAPQQVMSPAVRRGLAQVLNFSPPEELPSPPRVPRYQGDRALFSGEQLQRLRALEMEAPTLYGMPANPEHGSASTASSAVQAEVQRQLQEFMQHHRGETAELRQQVERLKQERQELQRLAGDRALHSQPLPQGDRALHSQQLPQGDRALHSQQLPQGDRALHSQTATTR